MRLILNRDGVTFVTFNHRLNNNFIPQIYSRSKAFKNEYFVLDRIETDETGMYTDVYYKFSFERSLEDGKEV